jgi:hypothetical protein
LIAASVTGIPASQYLPVASATTKALSTRRPIPSRPRSQIQHYGYIEGDSVEQIHVDADFMHSWQLNVVPITIGVSGTGTVDLVKAGVLQD